MSKYIGPYEIDKVEESDKHVTVTFKADEKGKAIPSETLTNAMFERVATQEPLDLSTLRDMRCFPVVERIIELLNEENIYMSELEFILTNVNGSLQVMKAKANECLWGASDLRLSIKHLDDILKVGGKLQDNEEA